MIRPNFYNRKARWKHRVKQLDKSVLRLLNAEARGDMIPVADYHALGKSLVQMGVLGEELATEGVKLQLTDRPISDIRDLCNIVEILSTRVKRVAEAKWGGELKNFPIYRTSLAATSDLRDEKMEREYEKMMKGVE